jgi:hypothetical protein
MLRKRQLDLRVVLLGLPADIAESPGQIVSNPFDIPHIRLLLLT